MAYVAAWLFVDVGGAATDEEVRQAARDEYAEEGRIEIDDGAAVSRA